MSDRGFLFLFSIVMIVGSLASAGWLLATGQAGTVDGLFLLLTALLMALVVALCVRSWLRVAMEAAKPAAPAPAAKTASAAAKPAAPATTQAYLAGSGRRNLASRGRYSYGLTDFTRSIVTLISFTG